MLYLPRSRNRKPVTAVSGTWRERVWRKKYFRPVAGSKQFMVAPIIRDNVIFQTFNLMDPIRFRLKFDVIFCRNVMIYFDQPTKDALMRRFYDALVPGEDFMISHSA